MKCKNCGFEDEGKFCSNCGATLQELPAITPVHSASLPDWQICISFGKSTSSNFERALFLSQAADNYIETSDESGKPIYQAFFTKDNYLQFIALYELIGNWKSCFVFINNEMVDRKIVSNINYCYGDKLRSGNPDFCYGASEWTKNPFGCHRAQMHSGKEPWYTFGTMDTTGIFHTDVEKIIVELQIRLTPYKYCPALDMEDVFEKASKLPRTINPNKQNDWEYTTYYYADGSYGQGVQPKRSSFIHTIEISLDDILNSPSTNKVINESKDSKKSSKGFLSRLFNK